MDQSLWAKRIADRIHTGEQNLDQCIASMMDVVVEIQKAQADMDVSPVATNASLSKFMETLTLLQDARTATVAGHRRIEKLGDALGIRTTGVGFNYKGIDDGTEAAPSERRAAI
jgi:hypothetical protein